MGRHRTPTKILEQHGSWRAKLRTNEPKVDPGLPEPPDEMTAQAKTIWRQVLKRLSEVPGLVTRIDGATLARYCEMHVRWWKANKKLAELGEWYPIFQRDENGQILKDGNKPLLRYMQPYPEVSVVKSLNLSMLQIEREFGMTPSSRASLNLPEGGADTDPMDVLNAMK